MLAKQVIKTQELFDNLSKKVENAKAPFDPVEHKDRTRSRIALWFTWAFFGLIATALVGIPLYNLFVQECENCIKNYLDVKETLLALSGIISAPFGFVIGYYFKGAEDK